MGVQEEGPGPGTKCLELNPSRAPSLQLATLLLDRHMQGVAYLVKPPGKGHNVWGETMFLLLTPSTAG